MYISYNRIASIHLPLVLLLKLTAKKKISINIFSLGNLKINNEKETKTFVSLTFKLIGPLTNITKDAPNHVTFKICE